MSSPTGWQFRSMRNSDLVLNMHLQPSGKAETVQPTLGLYFTDRPATLLPILLQMENDGTLDIPADAKDFVVSDEFTLPVECVAAGDLSARALSGEGFGGGCVLPDGKQRILIHIRNWDLNWQAVFRYVEPMTLPAGTMIIDAVRVRQFGRECAESESSAKLVMAGNRVRATRWRILWLQVLPSDVSGATGGDPRALIQEAMARHHVVKNHGDFEAHYNLGALLQARGLVSEAQKEYEYALRIRPEDAFANNAVGAASVAGGKLDTAVVHLQTALRSRPEYFDAHYNLGTAFAMQENFAGAAEEFGAAVRLNPEDANAEANLGAAFAAMEKWKDARTHLEKALAINPNLGLARDNLELVKQNLGTGP